MIMAQVLTRDPIAMRIVFYVSAVENMHSPIVYLLFFAPYRAVLVRLGQQLHVGLRAVTERVAELASFFKMSNWIVYGLASLLRIHEQTSVWSSYHLG